MNRRGFTIVELLIVIVVIAILATITVVAYNGIQDRARQSKINTDLTTIDKAIRSARINTGKTLYELDNYGWSSYGCDDSDSGTNLTDRTINKVNVCWVQYATFQNTVSDAGGINIRGILDPWGRPYQVDENENENGDGRCTKDVIGVYMYPHVKASSQFQRQIPNYQSRCL